MTHTQFWKQVEVYYPDLVAYAKRKCTEPEDTVHTAMLSLAENKSYNKQGKIRNTKAWLLEKVRLTILSQSRQSSKQKQRLIPLSNHLAYEVEQQLENTLVFDSLVEALPVGSGRLLARYYRNGETVEQLARVEGCSESAVKMRLARIRKTLRSIANS